MPPFPMFPSPTLDIHDHVWWRRNPRDTGGGTFRTEDTRRNVRRRENGHIPQRNSSPFLGICWEIFLRFLCGQKDVCSICFVRFVPFPAEEIHRSLVDILYGHRALDLLGWDESRPGPIGAVPFHVSLGFPFFVSY